MHRAVPILIFTAVAAARNAATQYVQIPVSEQGNYRVTVTLGDPGFDSVTMVKAELRRLMLESFNSWGQMLTRFFKPEIAIANHGESAESLRSFLGENRLAKLMRVIRPCDYLFIPMGYNDQKERGEGVGAFTAYPADLEIERTSTTYQKWAAEVAAVEKTVFIDLNEIVARRYDALGPENVEALFADPHTHSSLEGARLNADCVAKELRNLAVESMRKALR